MADFTFFTVEQYDQVSVLTWNESAVTRDEFNGELKIEFQAFLFTAKPKCVVVSFAQLKQCPSSLIGGLIVLNKQLNIRESRLKLCEMNTLQRAQFARLHLDRVFEIHDSLSDAMASCEEGANTFQSTEELLDR